MSVNLYDALKSSYGDKKSREILAKAGYQYDSMLSKHNEQVWVNPIEQKLLYSVAGTHNLNDWGTDLYLAAGHLKDTNRYKEADKTLFDNSYKNENKEKVISKDYYFKKIKQNEIMPIVTDQLSLNNYSSNLLALKYLEQRLINLEAKPLTDINNKLDNLEQALTKKILIIIAITALLFGFVAVMFI